MNKRDVLILVGLFGLWLLWSPIDRHFIKPTFFPDTPQPEAVEADRYASEERGAQPAEFAPAPDRTEQEPSAVQEPETQPGSETEADITPVETEPAQPAPPPEAEKLVELETELMAVRFSSRGGTIRDITLKDYPEFNEPDSDPVIMDFGGIPALGFQVLRGLTPRYEFETTELSGREGVRFTTELESGLRFERVIRITDDYTFDVEDTFINASGQPLRVPAYAIQTGRMDPVPGVTSTYGMFPLGMDTLLPAESVKRWAKDIQNRWVKNSTAEVVRHALGTPVDWVAVKNKYFVQSLRPRSLDTEDCVVFADAGPERAVEALWAALQFPENTLAQNERFTRSYEFYAGPQKLSRLKELGYHQEQIMELGWRPIRFFAGILMVGLSSLYSVFGNYGVAIMLLTVIIRVIFWPLTHKGTESMRRMQELSPLMKELNEKYKDDAQKRQQAMMELYKKHKVNPLGGCLPMVVQIPVFIGLFYLLRTAIELRYAGFLWISDLSEPEGLLADVLPLPLNILPIFMAVTMYFQQKLTPMPSSGDERQQQMHSMMMRIMPVMMLVLLYNFAAGLALYWSTQNVLMIVQQALYRRRRARQQQQA